MISQPVKLQRCHRAPRRWSWGVLAGLAGGGAELAWISIYGRLSATEAAAVARGVTGSLFPAYAEASAAAVLGVAIHMVLAVVLGLAITIGLHHLMPRLRGTLLEPITVTALLVGVWWVNFFVVLPTLNPEFAGIVPYWVSLVSKVSYGLAAALILRMSDRRRAALSWT